MTSFTLPRRVLLINPFGLGDVLFTTPVVTNLKRLDADVRIGYVCNRRVAPLLRRYPEIEQIFVYERDELVPHPGQTRWQCWQKIRGLIRDIRSQSYETALDFSLNTMIGAVTWLAGIPERVGFDYKGRGRFLTRRFPLPNGYQEKPVSLYYMDLLRSLGLSVVESGPVLPLSKEDLAWAERFFKERRLTGAERVVGLVPGGGASWGKDAVYKRWPLENYAKLADKFVEKCAAEIILMGSQAEEELCQRLARCMKSPAVTACGASVTEFAAMCARCALVVANDGGPLHMAAAVGARTVSVFGPVDERVYGPYPGGEGHRVVTATIPCRPCYRGFRRANCDHVGCLKTISVNDVWQQAKELL